MITSSIGSSSSPVASSLRTPPSGATRRARSPRGAWSRSGCASCNSPRPATSKESVVGRFRRCAARRCPRPPCSRRSRMTRLVHLVALGAGERRVVDAERHGRRSADRSAGPGSGSSTSVAEACRRRCPSRARRWRRFRPPRPRRPACARGRGTPAPWRRGPVSTSLPSRVEHLDGLVRLHRAGA